MFSVWWKVRHGLFLFLFTAMGKIVSESESAIYFVAQSDRTSINLLRVYLVSPARKLRPVQVRQMR